MDYEKSIVDNVIKDTDVRNKYDPVVVRLHLN